MKLTKDMITEDMITEKIVEIEYSHLNKENLDVTKKIFSNDNGFKSKFDMGFHVENKYFYVYEAKRINTIDVSAVSVKTMFNSAFKEICEYAKKLDQSLNFTVALYQDEFFKNDFEETLETSLIKSKNLVYEINSKVFNKDKDEHFDKIPDNELKLIIAAAHDQIKHLGLSFINFKYDNVTKQFTLLPSLNLPKLVNLLTDENGFVSKESYSNVLSVIKNNRHSSGIRNTRGESLNNKKSLKTNFYAINEKDVVFDKDTIEDIKNKNVGGTKTLTYNKKLSNLYIEDEMVNGIPHKSAFFVSFDSAITQGQHSTKIWIERYEDSQKGYFKNNQKRIIEFCSFKLELIGFNDDKKCAEGAIISNNNFGQTKTDVSLNILSAIKPIDLIVDEINKEEKLPFILTPNSHSLRESIQILEIYKIISNVESNVFEFTGQLSYKDLDNINSSNIIETDYRKVKDLTHKLTHNSLNVSKICSILLGTKKGFEDFYVSLYNAAGGDDFQKFDELIDELKDRIIKKKDEDYVSLLEKVFFSEIQENFEEKKVLFSLLGDLKNYIFSFFKEESSAKFNIIKNVVKNIEYLQNRFNKDLGISFDYYTTFLNLYLNRNEITTLREIPKDYLETIIDEFDDLILKHKPDTASLKGAFNIKTLDFIKVLEKI